MKNKEIEKEIKSSKVFRGIHSATSIIIIVFIAYLIGVNKVIQEPMLLPLILILIFYFIVEIRESSNKDRYIKILKHFKQR
jgi:phage-related holin